jgi:hypothetical protein
MKAKKELFIEDLASRILPAYDESGLTVDEYYQNIILPDLTPEQFQFLKELAAGKF